MRVSYNAVYNWLKSNADTCTIDQLHVLDDLIGAAKTKVREKQAHSQEALNKAEAAAKASGFASLEELLRLARPELAGNFTHVVTNSSSVQQRGASRKPYMDPEKGDKIYAAFTNRIPPELQPWIDKGWELSELHYKNIAAARKARGMSATYDPIARHAELKAEEDAKPNRIRRVSRKNKTE